MNTAPKESVPQTNAGEREREPQVRTCRYCGATDPDCGLNEPPDGAASCVVPQHCRDRCASALAEQAAQLAEERVEVQVWRDAVSAITAILTNTKSEVAALREMLKASGLYARHFGDCNLKQMPIDGTLRACDCGYNSHFSTVAALLATKPGSAPVKEE